MSSNHKDTEKNEREKCKGPNAVQPAGTLDTSISFDLFGYLSYLCTRESGDESQCSKRSSS